MIYMKILHKLYRIILILIAKFRLKLKKTGKTTRPFRYDLSQIPYDYTVEVTNMYRTVFWTLGKGEGGMI